MLPVSQMTMLAASGSGYQCHSGSGWHRDWRVRHAGPGCMAPESLWQPSQRLTGSLVPVPCGLGRPTCVHHANRPVGSLWSSSGALHWHCDLRVAAPPSLLLTLAVLLPPLPRVQQRLRQDSLGMRSSRRLRSQQRHTGPRKARAHEWVAEAMLRLALLNTRTHH